MNFLESLEADIHDLYDLCEDAEVRLLGEPLSLSKGMFAAALRCNDGNSTSMASYIGDFELQSITKRFDYVDVVAVGAGTSLRGVNAIMKQQINDWESTPFNL
jgi:hypothetical protein